MADPVEHPYVEWIAREAQRPVVIDPAGRDRVMAAVREEAARRPVRASRPFWSRIVEPRTFRLAPVTSVLLAAGLVGIGLFVGEFANNWGARKGGQPQGDVALQP